MSFFSFLWEADVRSANQGISHILWFVTLSSRARCWSVSESDTLCVVLWRANFFSRRGIVSIATSTTPPLVGCPRLFVKQIRNYPSCLAAYCFISSLRICHALVTRNPLRLYLWLFVHHWSDFDSLNIQAAQITCTVPHTFITCIFEDQSTVDNIYIYKRGGINRVNLLLLKQKLYP